MARVRGPVSRNLHKNSDAKGKLRSQGREGQSSTHRHGFRCPCSREAMTKFHNPESGPECHGCYEKLKFCHPDLGSWFWSKKRKYPNLHISDGWRGAEAQAQAKAEGRSDVDFPHSKHNKTLSDGTPQSLAIDVFQVDE